jgi:hypothetical protein
VPKNPTMFWDGMPSARRRACKGAAPRLHIAGDGRGRRQGNTFHGESWVSQRTQPRRREDRRAPKNPTMFWDGMPGARRRACKGAAPRLHIAGDGRGRRQGNTFHGESWVSQRIRLAKKRKGLGSDPWLSDEAKVGPCARVIGTLVGAAGRGGYGRRSGVREET